MAEGRGETRSSRARAREARPRNDEEARDRARSMRQRYMSTVEAAQKRALADQDEAKEKQSVTPLAFEHSVLRRLFRVNTGRR